MTSYVISYEIHDKHRETALLAALEIFEDRCKALGTVWFVCSPWSADQVRSYLSRCLGPGDSIVVEKMPVGHGWSGWVGEDVRAWLERHLGPSC